MDELGKAVTNALNDHAFRYHSGDHLQLFAAIITCHQGNVPPPDWVRYEIQSAMRKYHTGEAKDLNAAFDIHRPKGVRLPTQRAKYKPDNMGLSLIDRIFEAVRKEARDRPIDDQLFEAVAHHFPGTSAGTVKNYYYEALDNEKKLLELLRSSQDS